nr:EOG090X0C5Y [Polyphemus pediculus]
MGFTSTQMKDLIVAKPRLWMMNKLSLVQRFHYLHNEMKMEHETILKFPAVLTCREFRLKQRHEFLRHLKRDQFDPKLEHYVSPLNLIEHSDAHLEEMGFTSTQMKDLIVAKPRLWMMNKLSLVQRFHYLHNEMKMEHETILKFPAVLTCREFRLKQRHEFLRHLKRDQFDPKLEHYVSPLNLIEHSDAHFAANVARSTVLHFNDFCKTL